MKLRHLMSVTGIALALLLGACESPDEAAGPAAPAAPAAEAAPESPAPAEPATGDSAADALASVEESVEETIDDTADAAAEDTIELEAAPAVAAAPADWKYSEGSHFRRLTTSQGTSSPPDKIEVAEIFWYGCPHCYDFDPIIEQWKATLPADVSFVRIPVVWNPTNQVHARIMYTAEALGVLDKIHAAAFRAIHQQNNMLMDEADIIKLFKDNGVDEAAFREAYGSFGVTSQLKRAENLTRRYGIRSVPIIVVNGKYVTDGKEIRSFPDLLSVTEELVARERQDR